MKQIFTSDLPLLKPYFHGATSRSGAPFWLGSTSPYMPKASRVSGCMASSRRRPSTYGPSSTLELNPGMVLGSASVTNSTYFALPSGCTWLINAESE
jgi:hypothetical protein